MKSILIISPEVWQTNQVSKHHYARTLARRGHRVYFLGPPDRACSKIELSRLEGEAGELWEVRAPRVAPGLRFMPRIVRRMLEGRWLAELQRRIASKIDIVWLFENSRFYDMECADNTLKLYHQVDINQDFHVVEACVSADICFAVSDVILERIKPHAITAHKIPHGVLAVSSVREGTLPDLCQEGRVSAAYIGNLDAHYLDMDLLHEVVTRSPDVDFHMIGGFDPHGSFKRRFDGAKNVFRWGYLPSGALPFALAKMDILMLVYDTAKFREEGANPHKMMEYLATGKVTVATYTEEYKDFAGDLIAMADKPSDYLGLFREVISAQDRWNCDELREKRAAVARDNTYDRQLDRVSAAINGRSDITEWFGEIRL